LIPSFARRIRTGLSKSKGVVTTATVKAPNSLAILATTGAEPVPVPPPIPAVINTISAPRSSFVIISLSSSAACSPTSGCPPAPSPFVTFCPIGTLLFAFDLFNACKSVLIAMNSTPLIFASIIRFTAFEPPPPQPITLIVVGGNSFIKSSS